MFLTDERIKELQTELNDVGIHATADYIRRFFAFTEKELKKIEEKYLSVEKPD